MRRLAFASYSVPTFILCGAGYLRAVFLHALLRSWFAFGLRVLGRRRLKRLSLRVSLLFIPGLFVVYLGLV